MFPPESSRYLSTLPYIAINNLFHYLIHTSCEPPIYFPNYLSTYLLTSYLLINFYTYMISYMLLSPSIIPFLSPHPPSFQPTGRRRRPLHTAGRPAWHGPRGQWHRGHRGGRGGGVGAVKPQVVSWGSSVVDVLNDVYLEFGFLIFLRGGWRYDIVILYNWICFVMMICRT